MLFKITYGQIKTLLIASVTLLATWLFMGHYARFEVVENSPEGKVAINVSFLAPMNPEEAARHLTVTGEIPGKEVQYSTRWISRNTVQVIIDEWDYPRGLEYTLYFKKAPARIPPFTVSAQKKVRMGLAPKVIGLEPADNVPSGGPVILIFNTPVDPESFNKCVSTNAPGKFAPRPVDTGGAELRHDYSRWVLTPQNSFKNSTRYKISVNKGLRSAGGGISTENAEQLFTTAPALEIVDQYPGPGAPSIWLSRNITVKTNHTLKEAAIKVEGMEGKTSLSGDTVTFDPEGLFLPSKKYKVHLTLVSVYGERIKKEFDFGVTNLGNQRWIAVKLGNPCTVKAYEGEKLLNTFPGWLSIPQEKIPRVTMYELRRGSTLEFNPLDNSPIRYIRLNADITVHHLRAGETDTHSQIGLPHSYGCLLLNKPDLDWIFNNVPGKGMFVVH